MKYIFKSFHNKKKTGSIILIVIVLMSLFIFQSAATITFTNQSTLEKVEEDNSYHIKFSYTPSPYSSMFSDIAEDAYLLEVEQVENWMDSYISSINTKNDTDVLESYIKVHSTYMFYSYDEDFEWNVNATSEGNDVVDITYVTGYSNEAGYNQYEVMEGKELSELGSFELAIPYQYNEKLIAQGIDYTKLYFVDELNNQYRIASIYYSPNYIEKVDTSLDIPNDNDNFYDSSDSILDYQILANEDQLEALYDSHFERESTFTQVTYLLRVSDYSEYRECVLSTLLVGVTYSGSLNIFNYDLEPLYYSMQSETLANNVFKYLVYTMLIALLIADIFVFYSFMKRKLEENKERIGIMLITGVEKTTISLSFLISHAYVFAISLFIFIIVNLLLYFVFKLQLNTQFNVFYSVSNIVIMATMLMFILLFIFVSVMSVIQLQLFTKKGLMVLVKEKDINVSKPSKIKMKFTTLTLSYTMRDLFSQPAKLIRMFVATCFIIYSIFITYTSYQSVLNIYSEDTFGLTFDYLINPISIINESVYEEYSKLSEEYYDMEELCIEDISSISVNDSAYMDRLEDFNYINIYKYYSVSTIYFYDESAPFMTTLIHGENAEPTIVEYEDYTDTSPKETNVSYRIEVILDALIGEDAEDIDYADYERTLFKVSHNKYSTYYGDNTMEIKASQNSLINDGYVAFIPSYQVSGFYTTAPLSWYFRSLVNVKEGQEENFEEYLNANDVAYVSYDDYLLNLNESNQKVNNELMVGLIYVFSMLVLLLIIVIISNTLEDESYQRNKYDKMYKIGYMSQWINQIRVVKPLVTLCFSIVVAIILYLCIHLFYFAYLQQLLGLSTLAIQGYEVLIIGGVIAILLTIFVYVYSKKKLS